ncbi:MAG: ribulose-phosphate 3-epimerase [Candidatus Coatesbacteria bacterium]|nr:ribulose-phosphate 3-epimerase [Candidatus Coatesbacteria bacterium]
MTNLQLAPSILSANFSRLGEDIAAVERGGADLIHIDVMDGHFVPNITIGPLVVKAARASTSLPLDVHLMIEHPDSFIEAFAKAGADLISVQVEAVVHLERTIAKIKELGLKAGVVLNPATPLVLAEEIIPAVDFILLMSVNPGFAAQKFIPSVLDKISRLREILDARNPNCRIEVDGGIGLQNILEVARAGASMFVAGSAVFKTPDPEATTRAFKCKLREL